MENMKKSVKEKIFGKNIGVKSVFAALALAGLLIAVLLNIAFGVLADRCSLAIDLTRGDVFGLSDETVSYIKSLKQPVSIQVLATEKRFADNSAYNAQANEIMRQFARCSDMVSLSYVDYVANPTFAARHPDLSMKHGDILVSSGERERLVKTEELFNYTYGANGEIAIQSSRAEEAILSAVLSLTSDKIPGAAVIIGHGEHISKPFLRLLTDNNYTVTEAKLLTGGIPEGTKAAMLFAPASDLSPEEIEMLDAFLKNGGKYGKTLFYCAAPQQPPLPNLESFLAEWGVAVGDGLVFETDEKRVYIAKDAPQPFYAVADYANEKYASMMASTDIPMLVPVSRPLELLFSRQEHYYTETLLEFGASSGVRPSDAEEGFTADDAVRRGPMPALALCSRRVYDTQNAGVVKASSQVLVSGSVEMLDNYAVGNPSFANAQYIIHVLNSLCERSDPIVVTPKSLAGSAPNFTQAEADRLGVLFALVIPAVVLASGLAVWLFRRHK